MLKKKRDHNIRTEFTEPTLDVEAGVANLEDRDMYMSLLVRFVNDELDSKVKEIRQTCISGTLEEFHRAAHSLKGAASYPLRFTPSN